MNFWSILTSEITQSSVKYIYTNYDIQLSMKYSKIKNSHIFKNNYIHQYHEKCGYIFF